MEAREMKGKAVNKKVYFAAAFIVIAAAVILALVLGRRAESYRSIKIIELGGTVTIDREGVGTLEASSNMNLLSGDLVRTQPDAYVVLQLDSDKYVMLAESGSMTVVAEGNEANGKTAIHLEDGSVLSEIRNPLSEGSAYDIVTPNATMSVRGTVFEVRRNKKDTNGTIEVLVYDGKVAVGLKDGEPALYEAGEYTQFTDEEDPQYITERATITEDVLNEQFMERLEQINSQSRELDLGEARLASGRTQENADQASVPSQTGINPSPTAAPGPASTALPSATPSSALTPKPSAVPAHASAQTPQPEADNARVPEVSPEADPVREEESSEEYETENSDQADTEQDSEDQGGREDSQGAVQPEDNAGAQGSTENPETAGQPEPGVNNDSQENAGNNGNSGNAGNQGNNGNHGDAGNQGNNGNHGNVGNEGNQENHGNAGNQGNSGNAGNQGDNGNHGNAGNQGNHGNHGDGPDQGDDQALKDLWKSYTMEDYKAACDTSVMGQECTIVYYLPYIVKAQEQEGGMVSVLRNDAPDLYFTETAEVGSALTAPEPPAGMVDHQYELPLEFAYWCLEDGTPWQFDDADPFSADKVKADLCLYPVWTDEAGTHYYPVICRSEEVWGYYCNSVREASRLGELTFHNDPAFVFDGWEKMDWTEGSESGQKVFWDFAADTVENGPVSLKASWRDQRSQSH